MTQIVNEVLSVLPLMLTALGLLAVLVSAVVELTKDLPGIVKIPTKSWTSVVSIVLCVLIYLAIASYFAWVITWYFIFAVIVASFIVSFIATYGWDSFNELYKRFKK